MGNSNCKECTSSVFQDEEEEENWFEWMEATEDQNNKLQLVSPKTEVLAVQPELFRVDVHDKFRSLPSRGKSSFTFVTERRNLGRVTLPSADDEGVIASKISEYGENNNLAKTTSVGCTITGDESPYFPTGEVNVSLCFDQMTRRLKVQVVKARNLCCRASEGKKIDRCGVSWFDLYVKVSLLKGGKLLQSHRTSKQKGSSAVLIYENCAFDLSSLNYRELTLQLAAIHCCKNIINLDHVIGYLTSEAETSFADHLFDVIKCAGMSVNRWHTLWI